MKETEFEQALYTSIEEMKEEFKVVKSALDIEQEVNKSNIEGIKKIKTQVALLQKDLELERPRYGGDSTRKLARNAFNQSTASANWTSLEEHPIIKNIYESIRLTSKNLGDKMFTTKQRIDQLQPASEVFKELNTHKVIQLMRTDIKSNHGLISEATKSTDNDRTHGNQQDRRLRDKIADLLAAQDAFEFLLAEAVLTQDSGMMFVIGAFAALGHDPVAEGLRKIIKKPKEEKKKDASSS